MVPQNRADTIWATDVASCKIPWHHILNAVNADFQLLQDQL